MIGDWPDIDVELNITHRQACGLSSAQDMLHMTRTRSLPEYELTARMDLTQTDYETFVAWYTGTINYGNGSFDATWLANAGFAYHFARFRGDGFRAQRKGVRWSVSIDLEIIARIEDSPYWVE